ncbi:MAG: zf-HC2 domain-containing protein [Planctomycetes bacterium]|nr:zf-HC2 domain-containing protein [Planctomycetota bacterium]
MSCKRIQKLLPLYVGEDLDASELHEVKDHLKSCLTCYREYQDHLGAKQTLGKLSLEESNHRSDLSRIMDGFTDQVLERISKDPHGPSAPVPRLIYTYLPRALAAAAMLLVAITAGIYFLRGDEKPVVNPGSMVQENHGKMSQPTVSPLSESNRSGMRWVAEHRELERGAGNGMAKDGEEVDKYPDLEPLPQSFPRVQPVNLNRNF